MTFYAGIAILTELFMLAMSIHVIRYSGISKKQKTWFLLTFLTVMFCTAAEFAVHGAAYDLKYRNVLTVVTVLQFSAAPLLGLLFSGALGLPKQRTFAIVFFCLNLLVETVAAPSGRVFFFDHQGYHRGEYFIIYGAFYFFSLLYLVFSMIRVGKRFRHRDVGTIAMILVVLAAGIIPMTAFKINITYMAIAFGASLSYIYYNDLIQQDIQAELVANQEKMTRMQEHIISGLANLIENRDTETGEHVARTSGYVRALAKFARADQVYADQLDDHTIDMMYAIAPLHDVGKIVVPDEILKKPGRLTDEEFAQIQRHASEGGRVIREVLSGVADDEYLSLAADIAECHHERWDGGGYPDGIAGEDIPVEARVIAVADAYDAMASRRSYRGVLPQETIRAELARGSGKQFDPVFAAVMLQMMDEDTEYRMRER
jgi:hypothetical protein